MNEFERKLSQQSFRQPPSDLREAIFGGPVNVITPSRGTWRDCFWPSLQAWGALAALWLVFAMVQFTDRPASRSAAQPPSAPGLAPHTALTLLSYHHADDFRYAYDLRY